VQSGGKGFNRQTFEGINQCVRKAVQSIAMLDDAFAFDFIQDVPDLGGRVLMMVQERDKVGDGALKVNVVFPERVVGVYEQVLRRRAR
jgi:hypothetical protein